MNYKMSKTNIFEINVWKFWLQLSSCCAFYIVPNCIRNHHNTQLLHVKNYVKYQNNENIIKKNNVPVMRCILHYCSVKGKS